MTDIQTDNRGFPVSARTLPVGLAEAGFDGNIEFRPAFDDRATLGGESRGIGSLTLTFWLRGGKGAVTWDLLTGCYLPRTETEWLDRFGDSAYKPTPGAVEWHSPAPLGSGEGLAASCRSPPRFDCRLLGPGNPCYGDIGYTIGGSAYAALVTGGEAALWLFLAQMYRDQLDPDALFEPDASGAGLVEGETNDA